MDFNAAQKAAIETNRGALLVLAGPGTGKTRVLISKMQKLVETGLHPERILAITFSNKATIEMEERLARSAPSLCDRIEISTIHSWCQQLVFRHGHRVGFQSQPKLMTEAQAQIFFRGLSAKLPLEAFVKTAHVDTVLSELLSLLSRCKDEGLWPEDLIRYGQKNSSEEWEKLGDLYNAYQAYCLRRGFMDFGDVILFALRLLQDHEEVRNEVRSSYDAILVDEFQDTNWSQVELLRLMRNPSSHICAVGDDDQSIYRFRGASYSAFSFFEKAFSDFSSIELTETFRLSPQIAETSDALIRANGTHRYRPNKKIRPRSIAASPVRVLESASHEDEAAHLIDEVESKIKAGTPPGEICILGRSHKSLEQILVELRRRELPFQSSSSETLLELPIIQDVLSILRLIFDPTSAVDLIRIMDSPFIGLSEDEIYRFCRKAAEQKKPWIDFLETFETNSSALKDFVKVLKELKAHAYRLPLSETLFSIWEKTNVVKKILGKDDDLLKAIALFHSQISDWEKLQDQRDAISLLPLLEGLFKHQSSLEISAPERDPSKISIMTVHASKGLEFDDVYVVGLVGRRFPSNFSKPTWIIPEGLSREGPPTKEAHIEEERRLLYVAMTRARKSLTLTTVDRKGTKPSLFLSADLKSALSDSPSFVWLKLAERDPTERLSTPRPTQPFARSSASSDSTNSVDERPLNLSFTQLDRYDRCPLSYRFAYDLRIPTAPSEALAFGSAVHTCLEHFFRRAQKDEAPTKQELLESFDSALKEEALSNPRIDLERLQAMGRQQLAAFYDWHRGDFPKPQAIEEKFSVKIGPHRISGKIDRADPGPEGMIIIDYKTGRAKSSDDEKDQKFAEESLQFSIYALAAKEFFKWPLKELRFHYLAENTQLSTTRTSEDIEATKTKIISMAEAIQRRDFSPKPNRRVCRNCEYSVLCPSAEL